MVPVFGPKGSLQEITPTLSALKFDVNKVYDVQNITHWNGKRHGLLIQLNANTVLYNRNAFQSAGVKEPTEAWTWDDYVDLGRRLSQPEKDFWGTNLSPDNYYFFWAANVPYLDTKSTPPKTLFDTPAVKEVLRWMADLTLKHRAAPSRRANREEAQLQPGQLRDEHPGRAQPRDCEDDRWQVRVRRRPPAEAPQDGQVGSPGDGPQLTWPPPRPSNAGSSSPKRCRS